MKANFKLTEKNYEGKVFYGIDFSNHHEVVYLKNEKLRSLALKQYNLGNTAKAFSKEYHRGLPYYTNLVY